MKSSQLKRNSHELIIFRQLSWRKFIIRVTQYARVLSTILALLLFSVNSPVVAEDGFSTFEDEELDRQIQDHWENMIGPEKNEEKRVPILKHQDSPKDETSAARKNIGIQDNSQKTTTKKTKKTKKAKKVDSKSKEIEYTKLMGELNQNILLTPIQIDPYRIQTFANLVIQNRAFADGFLGVTQNKKGEYQLKILGIEEKMARNEANLFGMENSKFFVKIKHQSKQKLMGYYNHWLDSELFSVKSVRLKKAYEQGDTFWSRWQLVPILGEEWYLLKSYYDPKKCMVVKGNQKLVVKTCKTIKENQHWRFVKKVGVDKSDRLRDPNFPIL